MKLGLKVGDHDAAVARLHRVLIANGHDVIPVERVRNEFGASTLAAFRSLLRERGLAPRDEIDQETLTLLLSLEQNITINVNEGTGSPSTPKPDEDRGHVHGTLVDQDGAPVADAKVAIFEERLRREAHLGDVTTRKAGKYAFSYRRRAAINIVVRAYDGGGALLASSATRFAAAADVEVDLTTAKDGVVRSPSQFTILAGEVAGQLNGIPLSDLKENHQSHEIQFLASSLGVSFANVAYLFIAHVLGTKNALRDETLFGIFGRGIPASLAAALANLPDGGIDDAFTSQILGGVLDHSRATLSQALTSAVTANILPASYAATQDLELARLDDLRVQAVGATPYVRGKTPLNQLLAAGTATSAAQQAFVKAYADAGGQLAPTWASLRANTSLTKADRSALNLTLSAGELLTGNLLLVKDTLQRIASSTLTGLPALALLDQADWVTRITALDPQGTSIPPVLPDETPAQRIARFAKVLANRFSSRYPTTAFVGGLSKTTSTTFATKTELITFLSANPKLNLLSNNLDQYVASNKVTLSSAALAELKTGQRLLRVSPHYASVEALKTAGFTSAQSIYFKGRAPFLAQMTTPLGSAGMASMAYARAQMTYAAALTMFGRFNLALNGVTVAAMQPAVPDADTVANMPDLQSLFGSLDYFVCDDCQSVYSPAAYLVDLLVYLKQFAATGASSNARDAFLARRPEVQYIALDCNNTNTTLPYIDLVNEILEGAVAPQPVPTTPIDTTGTSQNRRALPQNVSLPAYTKLAAAIFPLPLPFDLFFARTDAYLTALGTSRTAVLRLFASSTSAPSPASVAGSALGLNPSMYAIVDTVATQPWSRWGFSSANPTSVLDPKTGKTFTPTPDWTGALAKVPIFMNLGNLTLPQLYQLLEATWVTQSGVTLSIGLQPGTSVLSADTDLMTFTGLSASVLDRANRFLRLWAACGLQMWELDWALESPKGSETTLDDFLVFLAGAIAIQTRLGLPFQETLSFWLPLETRDVTSHLGDEDTVVPSTYTEIFANPTMLQSWADVFSSPTTLSNAPITFAASASPTAAELRPLNAITAALGLGANDIANIVTDTGAANTLSLPTLNTLVQYARLATSLSIAISDLLLWIPLTGGKPFGGEPADTAEFLRRLAVLQGTGLAAVDLDYLLRAQSGSGSALAFTVVQATAVLQAIRDAIAKLPPASVVPPLTASTQSAIETIVVQALAAATNAPPGIIETLLAGVQPAVFPLSSAVISTLLGTPTIGAIPPALASLAAAFTAIANGAALFAALGPTETEFAFVVQNAPTFGWLSPAALPVLPTTVSPYAAFESLIQALHLDKRQTARTPKLFDVLGQWVAAGSPPDPPTAISGGGAAGFLSLATALSASPADVTAIAGRLGATAPGLTAATRTGSLADTTVLTAIASALDVASKYGISGAVLVSLAAVPASSDTAAAAMGAFQAQYPQSASFSAVQPVEDGLRENRRDALVAYLLGPGGATLPGGPFLTTDDIFSYFLIDPEMSPCAVTTRLLQASLAIQQFVQQCFLNLTFQSTVDMTSSLWSEWSWRQQYRLWQANREVFLYPENYVLPETRRNASPFFSSLENDVRQSNMDEDAAEAAFENYLRSLVEVARLVVVAHYNQINADGSQVLHVFARTSGTPAKWFYRTRTGATPGYGTWEAWQPLGIDINSDHLIPVIWDRRLHLLWAMFTPQSAKQSGQSMDLSASPVTSSPPDRYWVVQFAMSELSAGQWQPKRVFDQKMYFSGSDPALAYTFRAFQDSSFNLQIQVFWTGAVPFYDNPVGGNPEVPYSLDSQLVATGTLAMPDSPLVVAEPETPPLTNETSNPMYGPMASLPDPSIVDTSHEPSYSTVNVVAELAAPFATPTPYGASGQDLVYGYYGQLSNQGSVPLYVYETTTANGSPATAEILGTITNPRIVVPQQEGNFDALDPFFVADSLRTYLVEPAFRTMSSAEVTNLRYVPQWKTTFRFETFYHPYARTFLRELEIGGVPQLMSRNLQVNIQTVRGFPQTFNFAGLYQPVSPPVATPYPGAPGAPDPGETALDFDPGSASAYSLYNWEIFYHAPMYVASVLMQNNDFQDTMSWLQYIFNPTDSSSGAAPQRFWELLPFYNANAGGNNSWVSQQIQNILQAIDEGNNDPALQVYQTDPFDPHAIASLRPSAYAKATVMRFLDNLIAWGDSLYAQYTSETVNQAEQLYIYADMILGPRPQAVRIPSTNQAATQAATYASIANQLDGFSNTLVTIENLVVAPTPPQSIISGSSVTPTLPLFPSASGTALLFCVPPNAQLLAYWDTVAARLSNIRNCLNIHGVPQPLPLYAPPLNPLLLAEAAASGGSVSGAPASAPVYRFATYLQKATELTNDVRAYGSQILAALEKEDAETLAALRATQEVDVQTQMLSVKNDQLTEANDQVAALQAQKAVVQIRYNFYSQIAFMNDWESQAMQLQGDALIANAAAVILDMAAGAAHLIPGLQFGASGIGGTPHASIRWGGKNLGDSARAWAAVSRGAGGLLSQQAGSVSTLGGYHRRSDEWGLQANLAQAELTQLDAQIKAATDRVTTATAEVSLQQTQIANAQAVSDFLTNKYTNAALYNWMVTQLTTVYTQAYQLAFSLAQQAQNAFQYELGSQDSFIQFGYWDAQHKGLTAGDSLLFDLRRMEAAYVAENVRELEMTKHFSLALTDPMALVQLRESGVCTINLAEPLYERDNPGQYFRRLRSVALTIPCVSGPYTGVNAALTLSSAWVRTSAPTGSYQPMTAAMMSSAAPPANVIASAAPVTMTIATSSGQNDAGLFDVNLRDERWLPFEGQGAVSQWVLQLDPRDNAFDMSTVTDVVLHVRYTARGAGNQAAADIVRTALKPQGARSVLISVANTFADAYYAFFNPTNASATSLTLVLPLTDAIFPLSNLGNVTISDIRICFVLTVQAGGPMPYNLNPSSAASPVAQPALSPAAPWPATETPSPVLYGQTATFSPPIAPESLTVSVNTAAIPAPLAVTVSGQARLDPTKVQDILLIIDYTVA